MKGCVIFGGSGYIGTHLAKRFIENGRYGRVHLADIKLSPLEGQPGISYSCTDVREPIPKGLVDFDVDWVFNFAAVHREPGHEPWEYFATNLPGARNVCTYANEVKCRNMYFTSSISVYGPTTGPTSESSPINPITAYGGSKYPSELIHEGWLKESLDRRLIISRPGVVYGPGDPGNILRMMRAIKKGYFAFPGKRGIFKSYAYIYGLLDSIEFLMDRSNLKHVIYNYVETPTEPLDMLVDIARKFLGCKAIVLPIPKWVLMPMAQVVQTVAGSKNPIHPVRVRKAATPTHIIPQTLIDLGFGFRYSFANSLSHWREVSPGDFSSRAAAAEGARLLHLITPRRAAAEPARRGTETDCVVHSEAEDQ